MNSLAYDTTGVPGKTYLPPPAKIILAEAICNGHRFIHIYIWISSIPSQLSWVSSVGKALDWWPRGGQVESASCLVWVECSLTHKKAGVYTVMTVWLVHIKDNVWTFGICPTTGLLSSLCECVYEWWRQRVDCKNRYAAPNWNTVCKFSKCFEIKNHTYAKKCLNSRGKFYLSF